MLNKLSAQSQQLVEYQDAKERLVQLEDELETSQKTLEYY